MAISVVSYNIQFGRGLDGRYDIGRIADAVRDADIIALQEVSQNSPWNGGADVLRAISDAFPDRFSAFHPATDVDFGSTVRDGRAVSQRFTFGNMVLSRWPLATVRMHLLPRRLRTDILDLQRGALEAMVATPAGVIRFVSVHLDHIDPGERLEQVEALRRIALDFPLRGGAISGISALGFPEPPVPEDFLLLGDFNFQPGSAEYQAMIGSGDIIDATAADPGWSHVEPDNRADTKRLDYGFANPALAARVSSVRIDRAAEGSDHMPVWLTIG